MPGTVEIESEHEIATSAAVPGTAMRYPNGRVNLPPESGHGYGDGDGESQPHVSPDEPDL